MVLSEWFSERGGSQEEPHKKMDCILLKGNLKVDFYPYYEHWQFYVNGKDLLSLGGISSFWNFAILQYFCNFGGNETFNKYSQNYHSQNDILLKLFM